MSLALNTLLSLFTQFSLKTLMPLVNILNTHFSLVSLLSAGRMEARRVLVVTPLDSPDHVEVVRLFCRYLKDWCGVGR